ncbi:MAG TPA: hypothetical protein VH721_01195 [Gaiellaceae bacterium]|jgi:hypothetical protein
MKKALAVLATSAILASGAGAASLRTARTESTAEEALVRLPPAAKAGQTVFYGHVRSLERKGGRWQLRFDPAWWLGGVAAEHAAVEDGVLSPGEPVPNDYYIVEEGHRLLTFVVAPNARVTVLTRPNIVATRIPVSELAQIVRGKNPKHRRLMEPKAGFWIVVGSRYPNAVLSLDQQYQP